MPSYREKCNLCGSPARTEVMSNEIIGVEEFQFCVNVNCFHFDSVEFQREREKREEDAKESKSYQRKRRQLWKSEAKRFDGTRRRNAEMLRSSMA